MDIEMSNALRAPFDSTEVGQLPRGTCSDCRKAPGKVCSKHTKIECKVCGNYMTSAHVHLDYVGHADVTNRLLLVDPAWNWEPVAFDDAGQPKYSVAPDNQYALWIRLTIGGVTKIGVGEVPEGSDDILKQLVSDAIRNAAMRFGVALDLWRKGERLESTATVVNESHSGAVSSQPDVATTSKMEGEALPVFDVAKTAVPSPGVEDAPLPEYHGEDNDYDDIFDTDREIGAIQEAVVKPKTTTAPSTATALLLDSQKQAIKRLFDAGDKNMEARGLFIKTVVKREVGRLDELTRSEASLVLKSLMLEKESGEKVNV